MSSKTPWRTLWRLPGECPLPVHGGNWNFAQSFLNFIHVILDILSHLGSIQESRMFSKTPWGTLWRIIGDFPLPVHQEACNFSLSFINVFTCHSWSQKSSLDSTQESRMSFNTPWRTPWRIRIECPFPVKQGVRHFSRLTPFNPVWHLFSPI